MTVRYPAPVPNDVIFLIAYFYAQEGRKDGTSKQRLEGTIVGHGRENIAYVIGHWVFEGQLFSHEMEIAVVQFLEKPWQSEAGQNLRVIAASFDNGYEFQLVNDFCRKYQKRHFISTKGTSSKTGEYMSFGLINQTAGRIARHGTWFDRSRDHRYSPPSPATALAFRSRAGTWAKQRRRPGCQGGCGAPNSSI